MTKNAIVARHTKRAAPTTRIFRCIRATVIGKSEGAVKDLWVSVYGLLNFAVGVVALSAELTGPVVPEPLTLPA
jgi:hypothetical protein